MIFLRQGIVEDAAELSKLILSSAPTLLPYLFQGEQQALEYIRLASVQPDGQYSATRHTVATNGERVVGCVTFWDKQLPKSFNTHTLKSLSDFLSSAQLTHLLKSNDKIASVFLSPNDNQLCVGHLAVLPEYKGIGVGRKLIAHAIKCAKQRAKNQVVLDVDSENEEAISFYLTNGFALVNENEFWPTQQCFLRMSYTF